MKRLAIVFCAVLPFIAACKDVSIPLRDRSPHPAVEKDLTGKRFVLQMLDGNTISGLEGEGFDMAFTRDMQVSAKGCNRFVGKAILEGGVLSAPQAASTRMFCVDQLPNEMDSILSGMFTNGAEAVMERGKLKLSGEGHHLVYIPANFAE